MRRRERDAGSRSRVRTNASARACTGASNGPGGLKPADAAAAPPPAPTLPSFPSIQGPLASNPKPTSFDLGDFGTIYATGVVSGLALWQNHSSSVDHPFEGDVSNAQVFLNKTEGLFQFGVQAGAYSIPSLGTPYIRASQAVDDYFGPVPQWFAKLALTDDFSIEAGKLPTLIGAEYTFTFENMNIERGLLWNQEPAVSRGVQANYTVGPVAFSLSFNDGYYSNKWSTVSGSATWTVDKENTLAFSGSGNTQKSDISSFVTPVYQNNSQIYNLIWNDTSGPWTLQPYFQYTYVPAYAPIGTYQKATTSGIALLANYAFGDDDKLGDFKLSGFNLPMRVEYISSTGSAADGAPNLLYGQGSKAWSITISPTYQYKILFARAEVSFVQARSTTAGLAFGSNGDNTSQTRFLLEGGVMF